MFPPSIDHADTLPRANAPKRIPTPVLVGTALLHLPLLLPDTAANYYVAILGILTALGAGVATLYVSRSYSGGSQRTLRILGMGQLIYSFGYAGISYTQLVEHNLNGLGSQFSVYTSIGVFIQLVALLRLIPMPRGKEAIARAALDGFIVACSYFVLAWELTVRSVVHTEAGGLVAASTIGFVVFDALILLATFLAMSSETRMRDIPRAAILVIGLGMIIGSIGDLALAHYVAEGNQQNAFRFSMTYIDGYIVLTFAMWLAWTRSKFASSGPSKRLQNFGSTYVVFGFAAVSIPIIVIQGKAVDLVTIISVMSMFIALVGRQLLVVNENIHLNHGLEARVHERTEQLRLSTMRLAESEERFRSLVQQSSDVVMIVDKGLRITYVSPAAEHAFGLVPSAWLGKSLIDLCLPNLRKTLSSAIQLATVTPGIANTVEWELSRPNGTSLRIESSISDLSNQPSVNGIVLNSRDVSERFALEQRLRHQASHDALTGLANRTLFRANVLEEIERVRHTDGSFALYFCDLDGFKAINDSQGHAVGDELLIDVSSRLVSIVGDEGIVSRLGGDEFGIVTTRSLKTEQVESMAQRIIESINEPYSIRGGEVNLGISVGVASSDAPFDDIDDIMAKADLAMYLAKSSGKNKCMQFIPTMHDNLIRQLHLEEDLRHALARDQITVRYQPIFDLKTRKVVAAEALARWIHPELGMIPPSEFIPVAEETGQIIEIGRWILEQACQVAFNLFANYSSRDFRISVNVSGTQLRDPSFLGDVERVLNDSGAIATNLVLEVTESMFLSNDPTVSDQVKKLRALGIHVAIDDFGTGYSSLSSIKQFEVDYLKIDRSFVTAINDHASGHDLVKAIIGMGDSLGMTVVAEGIENQKELAALMTLGCQYGQGFMFSEPVPALALASELADTQKSADKPANTA